MSGTLLSTLRLHVSSHSACVHFTYPRSQQWCGWGWVTLGPMLLATTLDCTPNAQLEFQLLSPPKVGRFCSVSPTLPSFVPCRCSNPCPSLDPWACPGDMASPSHCAQPHTRWLSRGAPKAQVWLSLGLGPFPGAVPCGEPI